MMAEKLLHFGSIRGQKDFRHFSVSFVVGGSGSVDLIRPQRKTVWFTKDSSFSRCRGTIITILISKRRG